MVGDVRLRHQPSGTACAVRRSACQGARSGVSRSAMRGKPPGRRWNVERVAGGGQRIAARRGLQTGLVDDLGRDPPAALSSAQEKAKPEARKGWLALGVQRVWMCTGCG